MQQLLRHVCYCKLSVSNFTSHSCCHNENFKQFITLSQYQWKLKSFNRLIYNGFVTALFSVVLFSRAISTIEFTCTRRAMVATPWICIALCKLQRCLSLNKNIWNVSTLTFWALILFAMFFHWKRTVSFNKSVITMAIQNLRHL